MWNYALVEKVWSIRTLIGYHDQWISMVVQIPPYTKTAVFTCEILQTHSSNLSSEGRSDRARMLQRSLRCLYKAKARPLPLNDSLRAQVTKWSNKKHLRKVSVFKVSRETVQWLSPMMFQIFWAGEQLNMRGNPDLHYMTESFICERSN